MTLARAQQKYNETNISGLIVGKSSKDSELFIPYLREKL